MLIDLYLEELEKQARLAAWSVKNLAARVAPINNTKVLSPVRKQLADQMNRAANQNMRGVVAQHTLTAPTPGNIGEMTARNLRRAMGLPNPIKAGLQNVQNTTAPLTNKLVALDNKVSQGLVNARKNVAEWLTRSPSDQAKSIGRNIVEGSEYSGKIVPNSQGTVLGIIGGRYTPNPGVKANDPAWYWKKLSKR